MKSNPPPSHQASDENQGEPTTDTRIRVLHTSPLHGDAVSGLALLCLNKNVDQRRSKHTDHHPSWCCHRLAVSSASPDSGLAVLEPLGGLYVSRGGVHVEGAFAGLLELVGTFSAELLVLVKHG